MTFAELESLHPVGDYYDVRDQFKRHVYDRSAEAFARGDRARDEIATLDQLRARQAEARRALLDAIGGLPSPSPGEGRLDAHVVGVMEAQDYRIEKVIFQSRPRHYVTANLYLPEGIRGRTGAVLFLCGHHEMAKHEPQYQRVCQRLVRAGLVVLAQDPIGQGERLSYFDPATGTTTVRWGTFEHEHAGAQCLILGDCIARYFLHDAMRGIDYLLSRPEVDGARIGVTGNSGGGTQTSLLMLADSRIAAAAPGTFITSRESYQATGQAQDAEQIWPGFTAAGFDHEDILLAMAPRPVRVLAVTYDGFPIEGTRRTVARCHRLWDLAGAGSNLDLVEDADIHRFTDKLAIAAADFFSRHLLGRECTGQRQDATVIDPPRLWCTRSGQVRRDVEDADFVFEANQQRLTEVVASRPRDSAMALEWLRSRVYAHRLPVEPNPRVMWTSPVEGLEVQAAFWFSQKGLVNGGYALRDPSRSGQDLPVTIALWDGGTTSIRPHLPWIRQSCSDGRAVVVLDVTGFGALASYPINPYHPDGMYGTLHKLADDLLWLGDDLAALRTFDVLRALDAVIDWPGLDVAAPFWLYGHGRAGVYAQLAAALDARVERLHVRNGLDSYAALVESRHYDPSQFKSFLLRGVLHYFDLPDLMRGTCDRGVDVTATQGDLPCSTVGMTSIA